MDGWVSAAWARWARPWPPTWPAPASPSRSGIARPAGPGCPSRSAPSEVPYAGGPRRRARHRRPLRVRHPGRRGRPLRPGRRRRGRPLGQPRHRLLHDRPVATRDFAARLADQGVALVDAPVSGGSEGALQGTLTIMVGGAEAAVERASADPRGHGPHHHAHGPGGRRAGHQGRQPGRPRGHVPGRGRGRRAGHQGRARPREGRRRARRAGPPARGSSRTAAAG